MSRVTPVWTRGSVPKGYWDDRANRIAYMRWLAKQLGIRDPEEWHGVDRSTFIAHYGSGLLAKFGDSPLALLRDYMPAYEWKPWLMRSTPQRFWHNPENRRWFMNWLGRQLGFERREDWYAVTPADFREHGGEALLNNWYGSVIEALREHFPDWEPKEWLFSTTPHGFWDLRENRRRFMAWLGAQLGIKRPEDWYGVRREDFYRHGGAVLLRDYYDDLPLVALEDYMPEHDWKPWLFSRVPAGFWDDPDNRRAYLKWLGDQLGFRRPSDWYRLRREDMERTGGGALLREYYGGSLLRAMQERYPRYRWRVRRKSDGVARPPHPASNDGRDGRRAGRRATERAPR